MPRTHLLILAAALTMALAACRSDRGPRGLVAAGHVEATEVRVSPEVGGKLVTFPLMEGDRVTGAGGRAHRDHRRAAGPAAARAEREQAAAELRLRLAGRAQEDMAELEAQVARRSRSGRRGGDLARMQGLLASGSGTAKARDDAKRGATWRPRATGGRRASAWPRCAPGRAARRSTPRGRGSPRAEARIAQLEQQIEDAVVNEPGGRGGDREDRRGGRDPAARGGALRGHRTSTTPGSRSTWPSRTSAASASGRTRRS